jgi:hypothetical protein
MRSRFARAAFAAGAGALACLVVRALASRQRAATRHATRRERDAALSDWEAEGGGLAASHGAPRP